MGSALRILLHDYAGYGFIAQAARELASRGHELHHLYNTYLRSGKGVLERQPEDPPTLSFERITIVDGLDRYNVMDRLRLERSYARALVGAATRWEPDVVLSANTPLLVLRWAHPHLARDGIPLVNWLQDLHSLAMGDELIRRAGPLGRAGAASLRLIEARLLRACAAVVPVTTDFVPILQGWKVAPERITVVPNWAEIVPIAARSNSFSTEHDLDRKVTLLYAGTLGLKHEPQQLVRLAEAFRDRPEVRIVVVSEGLGRTWLDDQRRAGGLSNLTLVDFQPTERVCEVLASADVLLSMLRPDAARFSVPSKILAYLVAGQAQLSALPADNLAARTLTQSGGGVVVDPNHPDQWVDAARRLIADPAWRDELGRRGRAYAEENFDVRRPAEALEEVLLAAVARR